MTAKPVFLVFAKSYKSRLFVDVFDSREAAELGIERDRDQCDHPLDLEDYEIEERIPKGRAG